MPTIGDQVIVSPDLAAVRLRGQPRLIGEPEDFREYYLAEDAVDPGSLPARVRKLRDARVRFLSNLLLGLPRPPPGPLFPENAQPECGKLGKISAMAWADEEGLGWRQNAPLYNARRAFRDGAAFLVADVNCGHLGEVATVSPVDDFWQWQVRSLSTEKNNAEGAALIEKGRAALATEPALAVQNSAYESYRRKSGESAAEHWWSLPQCYQHWSYATAGSDAGLLITELSCHASSDAERFTGEWLGVWCVTPSGALVSLSPNYAPSSPREDISNHWQVNVVGPPKSLPIIFYAHSALRPEAGRYEYYEYTLSPPPELE